MSPKLKHTGRRSKTSMTADTSLPPSMDQTLGDLRKLLEAQSFDTMEEANAYIQQVLRENQGQVPHVAPATPLEQAMELVYAAQSERSQKRRVALARQALEVSPDCAEAYNLLAETDTDPSRQLHWLEQGVAAGERAIGAANFKEWEGMFWGMVETRPYMRALAGVAELSWLMDDRARAIQIYQRMLVLNPGDNQGIRYSLSTCLLEENTPQARSMLETLLGEYPDDGAANWAFSLALLLFQKAGHPTIQATHALKKALKVNRHIPAYLLGRKPMPKQMPQYIGLGDENEAVEYTGYALSAWAETPGALDWLRLQAIA